MAGWTIRITNAHLGDPAGAIEPNEQLPGDICIRARGVAPEGDHNSTWNIPFQHGTPGGKGTQDLSAFGP